jgi:plastocyanin
MPSEASTGVQRVASALVLVALVAGACGKDQPSSTDAVRDRLVAVAIDNHFHDIHPSDHRRIAFDGTFVVRSEARNLHNVTFVGTDISEDLRPGEILTWDPIGEYLAPGTYQIICKYHDWAGMQGELTVRP